MCHRLRHLKWTIEWVHPDGRKELGSCTEIKPISEAYAAHTFNSKRQFLEIQEPHRPKKRKKGNAKIPGINASTTAITPTIPPLETHIEQPTTEDRLLENPTETSGTLHSESTQSEHSALKPINGSPTPDPFARNLPIADTPTNELIAAALTTAAGNDASTSDSAPALRLSILPQTPASTVTETVPPTGFDFYLHSPSLPSKYPVLIPLSPDANLAASLSNRLVLEFPTIYVFHRQQEDKLPEGFISEKNFYAQTRKDIIEEVAEDENGMEIIQSGRDQTNGRLEEGEIGESRLLEVLKVAGKDLGEI